MKKIKKVKKDSIEILTIDQSLNGSGIIHTKDGVIQGLWYMTDKRKNLTERATLINPKKLEKVERLALIKQWFVGILSNVGDNCIVGLEGYAYGAKGMVFELGELGGMIKLIAWEHKKKFIIVPPDSIKMFATTKGNAVKSMMVASAITQHKQDFSRYGESGEDLADAFWMNQLILAKERCGKDVSYFKKLPLHQREALDKKKKKQSTPTLLEIEYIK